jgi:putrescine transport system substrate-binding protein
MRLPIRLVLITAVCAAIAPAAAQPKRERVVNVYNWSDYIAPSVVEDFTKATGIKVRYDTFDSNDTLETKLLAGKSGYDVVVPTAYFLERQIKASVFQKLDKEKLPNLANMWPEITQRLAAYDPGNQYAVNYMWGTTGIGYNARKARELLGPNGTIDSWDIVFKPENLAKFKDCDAKNVAEANEFINYLQQPEVAARNTNFISYANGNLASQKFVDKAILDDKTIYPDEATMRRLYTISAHDPKTQRLMNRLWTRIKTGR